MVHKINKVRKLRREGLSWQVLLLLCFFLCFFFGILTANGMGRHQLLQYGRLNDYYVEQLAYTQISSQGYLRYIGFERLKSYLLLALLGLTWLGVPVFILFIGWCGFSLGYLFVSALVGLGLPGMAVVLASLFPQILLYLPAYFWLVRSLLENGHNRLPFFQIHGTAKNVYCVHFLLSLVFFLLGIWLEGVCSPVLLKIVVGKIL